MIKVLILVLAVVILIRVWTWALRSTSAPKKKKGISTRYSRHIEEEPPYQSPLGLVDNPDDEWVEWAIMDDLLNDQDEC